MSEQNEMPEDLNIPQPTEEEIDRHYQNAFDSVAVIKGGNVTNLSDEEWGIYLKANKDHLQNIMDRPYMQGKDFTEFLDAINNY